MKLYAITNAKCLGIQAGIQGLHSTVELMLKYKEPEALTTEWASTEKTVAVVNGGNHQSLQKLLNLLENSNLEFAEFREEDLNDAITSIAVVCSGEHVQHMAYIRSEFFSTEHLIGLYGEETALVLDAIARMRTM